MPFCIVLQKPHCHPIEHNREWIRVVRDRFPEFAEDERDREDVAEDVAEDVGMTPREYIERGIGVALEHEADGMRVRLGFRVETAEIELPNFPVGGIDVALTSVMPLLGFLESEGFSVIDPDTERPFDPPLLEALRFGYTSRQAQVERVAKMVGGAPAKPTRLWIKCCREGEPINTALHAECRRADCGGAR